MPGYEVFDERERQAVNDLFDANGGVLFAHGFDDIRNGVYRVREFEAAFAARFGFPHAQAVSTGSAAVRLALETLGVGAGDEVIVPAHTFIATVEAVLQVGAIPVVVDIDESLNIDPAALERAITARTRAVVPVHMMGEMADMETITALAEAHDILVVEDCAQALGASLRGAYAGSWGHSAAFSTDAGKTVCTGEGGFVVTRTEADFIRSRALHDHGHTYEPGVARGLDPAIATGFNYRMTELQAAIGLVQLDKLDTIISRQRENKARFVELLAPLGVPFRPCADPAGALDDTLVLLMPSQEQAASMAQEMAANRVGTKNLPSAMRWHFAGWWEHLLGPIDGRWAASAEILNRCIALPVNVLVTEEQIDRTCSVVSAAARSVL
jgi:8-amino-3,8-dideoxy-alpha-D-manno-octulosonate transaminase